MTDVPPPIRCLASFTDLIESIPMLLGFHPQESIVILALHDNQVVLTARTDLHYGYEEYVVPQVSAVWRRIPDATIIAIAFADSAASAWLALDEIDQSLPRRTLRVTVHADDERWYDDPDSDGIAYDARGSVHSARAAFEGRIIRDSRDELYELLWPRREHAEVEAALERMATRDFGAGQMVAEALALMEGHDVDPHTLGLDETIVLSLAAYDPRFLNAVMASTTRENAAARMGLWIQVVQDSVPRYAGAALVALGVSAWLAGQGAFATVCLEEIAGRFAPDEWVRVLAGINADAAHPSEWEERRAAVVADVSSAARGRCRRRTGGRRRRRAEEPARSGRTTSAGSGEHPPR